MATTEATTHEINVTRTPSAISDVPDGIHLRCTCGWTSSAPDEDSVDAIVAEHRASGDPAPTPATVSPN